MAHAACNKLGLSVYSIIKHIFHEDEIAPLYLKKKESWLFLGVNTKACEYHWCPFEQ